MEVSGQFHDPAALLTGKEPPGTHWMTWKNEETTENYSTLTVHMAVFGRYGIYMAQREV
jgi:hypothetical protein